MSKLPQNHGMAKRRGTTKHCVFGICRSDNRKSDASNYSFLPFTKPCTNVKSFRTKATPQHISMCEMCNKCDRWLKNCNRSDGRFQEIFHITKYKYICTKHFVKPELLSKYPDPLPEEVVRKLNATIKEEQIETDSKMEIVTNGPLVVIKSETRHNETENQILIDEVKKELDDTNTTLPYEEVTLTNANASKNFPNSSYLVGINDEQIDSDPLKIEILNECDLVDLKHEDQSNVDYDVNIVNCKKEKNDIDAFNIGLLKSECDLPDFKYEVEDTMQYDIQPGSSKHTLHHSEKEASLKRCICPVCKEKFASPVSMDDHLNSHFYNAKVTCMCGKKYSDKKEFLIHNKTHYATKNDDAINNFECEICSHTFTVKSSYMTHLESHDKVYEDDLGSKRLKKDHI